MPTWRELVAEKQGAAPVMASGGGSLPPETPAPTDEPDTRMAATETPPSATETPPSATDWRALVAQRQQTVAPAQAVTATAAPLPSAPRIPAKSPYPEKRGETVAAQQYPELGQQFESGGIEPSGLLAGENPAKVAAIAPVLLTTTNPREIGDILSKNFPGIGVVEDAGGNLIAVNNKTGSRNIINRPGLSQLDLLQGIGIGAAFLPSGKAAGLAGRFAPGLTAKVAAGATAAAGTQAGMEAIQSMVGGELDADEVAIAGALGGAAETVGPIIKVYRDAKLARGLDAARRELGEILNTIKPGKKALEAIKQATGVDVGLFQAQQTLQPSTLLKQRLMPQLDAGAKIAAKALEKQNKEVYDAAVRLIDTIAPASAVERGAKGFKSAAERVVKAAKDFRADQTKELYDRAINQAVRDGVTANIKPVKRLISMNIADAPQKGKVVKTMRKVSALLEGDVQKIRGGGRTVVDASGNLTRTPATRTIPPNMRRLQKAKFEIDELIDGLPPTSSGNTMKRMLVEVKSALVNQMNKASPLYKEANKKFEVLSQPVNRLQDSVVGQIAAMKDKTLKLLSGKIFDATESNPAIIKNTRKLISDVDPTAWDELLRTEFQRRVGGIKTLAEDMPGELVGNVPGQLRRAIFGNPEKRRVLLAGMTDAQRKNFVYLDDVLRRASAGRAAGSPTEPYRRALEKLRGTAMVIRDLVGHPVKSLQGLGEGTLFDRNVKKLTEALFDPQWESKMRRLRNLDQGSDEAGELLTEILNGIKVAPQALRTDSEE